MSALFLQAFERHAPKVLTSLNTLPESGTFFVAFSGGLDSTILLYLLSYWCRTYRPNSELRAVHVHHGLSANADEWAAHCTQVCSTLSVPLHVHHVSIENTGEGFEAAARRARYDCFAKEFSQLRSVKNKVLLQGHHANDQAETLLLRILRGAGPEGIASIPVERTFSDGVIFRPLLSVERHVLEQIAESCSLTWVDDESNFSDIYDRNYIRSQVLPILEQRWPKAVSRLNQSAAHCADASETLTDYLDKELSVYAVRSPVDSAHEYGLDLSVLADKTEAHQRLLLKQWIQKMSGSYPGEQKFFRIFSELLACANDRQPLIHWRHQQIAWYLRRFQGVLWLSNLVLLPPEDVVFEGDGFNAALIRKHFAGGLWQAKSTGGGENVGVFVLRPLPGQKVSLRFRRGGERILCANGRSQPVKKLLQALPPWWRERVPLLYYDETLVAVGDLAVAEEYDSQDCGTGICILWRH